MLDEPSPEIMAGDVAKVLVADPVGGVGGLADDRPDAAGSEVDVRIVLIENRDPRWSWERSRLTSAGGTASRDSPSPAAYPSSRDPEPVVVAVVAALDMTRLPLWHLERPEAGERAGVDKRWLLVPRVWYDS
jgi:hypothetical protein